MFKTIKTYRSKSLRMPGWDYSRNGKYFITMTVEGWHHWFGEIVNGEMVLSDFGRIVQDEWYKSFNIRKELYLDEFQLMPNHLHAIVVLKNTSPEIDTSALPDDDTIVRLPLKMEPKSISSFIAGFKSASTCRVDDFIDEAGLDVPKFNRKNRLWHNDYYDIIVRNDRQYKNFKNYIINNVRKWVEDKFNAQK